jgi:hypothetical protein
MSKPKPEGKYWQSMDPTASWWQAMMDMVPSMQLDASSACGGGGDEDKDVEKDATNKPSAAKRQSTCSTVTVLEDFSFHGDTVGWETAPSKLGCKGRLKQMTTHPSFRKRFGICIGITLLFIIALVSALAFNLSYGEGGSASGATGTDTNVPNTGGGGTETGDVPDTGGGTDTNVTDTNVSDTGGGGTDTGDGADTGGGTDTNVTDTGDFGTDAGGGGGGTTGTVSIDLTKPASPFSTLHPVDDLGMFGVVHKRSPPESVVRGNSQAVPTSAWYENLLVADGEPTSIHKAYVIPYLVDAVGPIPGLRVHSNHLTATSTTIQLEFVETHGLTLGAFSSSGTSNSYSVVSTNPLGLTLKWVRTGLFALLWFCLSNFSPCVIVFVCWF